MEKKIIIASIIILLILILLYQPISSFVCSQCTLISCDISHIGYAFHQLTKTPSKPTSLVSPDKYKTYSGAEVIPLPSPKHKGISVEDAIRGRRSIRGYSEENISLYELSELIFAAQGITDHSGKRASPSAGALYPIETYLFVNRVEGLENGIYHYNVREHSLEFIKKGNFSNELYDVSRQPWVAEAAVVFAFTAIFERTTSKYGQRGYRYIYMEVGHIAENVLLESVSLGLASVPIGAFNDDALNILLGVDGEKEAVVYMVAIGKPLVEV